MKKIIESHYFKLIISSILSGLIMAIVGFELVAAKSMNVYYLGGFIQGFGLLVILYLGLEIYNTKVLTIFSSDKKLKALLDTFIVLVVNILTIVAVAVLCRIMTNDNELLVQAAKDIAEYRIISVRSSIGKEWYDALIASLMCGFIVGIGVNVYKRSTHPFIKVLSIVLPVGIYVACGFEQIMTNTFYVVFASMFSTHTLIDLLIVLIGNTVACIITYFAFKAITPKKK